MSSGDSSLLEVIAFDRAVDAQGYSATKQNDDERTG